MLLIKIGKEIQRFAGHIGTLPAMLKTLALATGRYLANTIEWMTVSGDTTPQLHGSLYLHSLQIRPHLDSTMIITS